MSKVMVVGDGNKFKVLVDFVQRGISFSGAELANSQALEVAEKEHTTNVTLYKESALA